MLINCVVKVVKLSAFDSFNYIALLKNLIIYLFNIYIKKEEKPVLYQLIFGTGGPASRSNIKSYMSLHQILLYIWSTHSRSCRRTTSITSSMYDDIASLKTIYVMQSNPSTTTTSLDSATSSGKIFIFKAYL